MQHFVKLNPSAHIFFDQASKIKVVRGEVVELTESQYNLRVIQAALNNGYLKEVSGDKPETVTAVDEKGKGVEEPKGTVPEKEVPEKAPVMRSIEELQDKFVNMVENGDTVDEIKDKFKTDELKALAESYDIMPEDGDTKATLVEAIMDELEARDEEEDK